MFEKRGQIANHGIDGLCDMRRRPQAAKPRGLHVQVLPRRLSQYPNAYQKVHHDSGPFGCSRTFEYPSIRLSNFS